MWSKNDEWVKQRNSTSQKAKGYNMITCANSVFLHVHMNIPGVYTLYPMQTQKLFTCIAKYMYSNQYIHEHCPHTLLNICIPNNTYMSHEMQQAVLDASKDCHWESRECYLESRHCHWESGDCQWESIHCQWESAGCQWESGDDRWESCYCHWESGDCHWESSYCHWEIRKYH